MSAKGNLHIDGAVLDGPAIPASPAPVSATCNRGPEFGSSSLEKETYARMGFLRNGSIRPHLSLPTWNWRPFFFLPLFRLTSISSWKVYMVSLFPLNAETQSFVPFSKEVTPPDLHLTSSTPHQSTHPPIHLLIGLPASPRRSQAQLSAFSDRAAPRLPTDTYSRLTGRPLT